MSFSDQVGAVILAAGKSTRMGRPKLILPWGNSTVIGRVVEALAAAGVDDIVCVVGAEYKAVEAALKGSRSRTVFNPRFEEDHMILSLQIGMANLSDSVGAALVALGDAPRIDSQITERVIACWRNHRSGLVIPSYQNRRGHPWLVTRGLWADLLSLEPPSTAREFIDQHADDIEYVEVENDSILRDIDTPEDYHRERPHRS